MKMNTKYTYKRAKVRFYSPDFTKSYDTITANKLMKKNRYKIHTPSNQGSSVEEEQIGIKHG